MNTLEIDAVLAAAYDRSAGIAAGEIRKHLRPFNLKRHPVIIDWNNTLRAGNLRWWELTYSHPVHKAIREVGEYVERLPEPIQERLKDHL